MKKRILVLPIMVWLLCCCYGSWAIAGEATNALSSTIDNIIDIFKTNEPMSTKLVQIGEAIEKRFDYRMMGSRALGANWRKLSANQQHEFVRLFQQLLERTYVRKMAGFSDEKVVFLREIVSRNRNMATILTQVIMANKTIPVSYKMARKKSEWFVYDIQVEGVSLVRNYRTNFKKLFRKQGYAGLIEQIKNKLVELD